MLSDNENVRALKAFTLEASPKILELNDPESIKDAMHNCGLTAFVTEVEFALAPKTAWYQYAIAYDDFYEALESAEKMAFDKGLKKRLLSVFEWPIPSYFSPLVKKNCCPEGKALTLLMTDLSQNELVNRYPELIDKITFNAEPTVGSSRGFQVYDFTWNHTTMWAMKYDKNLTYLQDAFDRETYVEQIRKRKEKYGEDVQTHVEFLKADGEIRPGGLSVVNYKGKEHLYELIDWCKENGIRVSNPHTHFLDADIRWFSQNIVQAKKRWDPKGLLNPGHLRTETNQP